MTAGTGTPAHPDTDDRTPRLLVVGIGASAGGIAALREFFSHVEARGVSAYVVILHLSPDHDSRLASVLQTATTMPVIQVTARTRIEADHIYVISPNRSLEVVDGDLVVNPITRVEQRRAPVDVFFRALADAHGSRSVSIVLSGSGPNGSAGLKRVKEYGGLTIAQDPAEAEFSDMPRNAIATGLVDLVLPVADMNSRIRAYEERLLRQHIDERAGELAVAPSPMNDPEAMRDVMTLLRVRTGHDFSNYKPATLQRRIERRIHLRGLPSLGSYARTMREQPDEAVALMKELLISVTNFFRDPAAWDVLERRVIPRLFSGKQPGDQVRVWVPGCATGEEAYSIAMLLAERAGRSLEQPSIQIFATDLDDRAIGIAREGTYSEAEVADVPEARLTRFFQREASGYRVRREVREMLLFAHHNVIKDPPFSHLDLISCRNLLIYLNRSIQERVVETFHFALRPGGALFLGASEAPEGTNDLFLTLDKGAHIYESRSVTSRLALPLADAPLRLPQQQPVRLPEPRPTERISPGELHQRLLEQYAPPSLVVTDEHHVVHVSDRAGRYLQISGGEPSRDLLRMARPDLRPELRAALHQASKQRTAVQVRGVRVSMDDHEELVTIWVKPVLHDGDQPRGYFLVTFEHERETAAPAAGESLDSAAAEPIAQQLEEELARLKAQLRITVEQYETQVEEAKASNEELQAMNEELRSAAEELETSKEELQSVNEELTTVNQELKVKIEELGLTNNDFQNLINASDIGTIFLDRDLRVKLSTPAARKVFNLLHTDIGRPLSDITSQLLYDGLHDDVREVLHRLQTVQREVQTRDGHWYVAQVRPYRTLDDRIDGVVITFQDITERRQAQENVQRHEERLRLLLESTVDYAMFTLTPEGLVDSWNPGAERMFGYHPDQILGQPSEILFTPEDRAAGVPQAELVTALTKGRAADERYHLRKDGTRFFCSGVTTTLGANRGFAKIARDLTEQRRAAEEVQHAHEALEGEVATRTNELREEIQRRTLAQEQATMLLTQLVSAREEERARIARDLHDQLGQQLTALRLLLERQLQESPGVQAINSAIELLGKVDSELDFLAWELRPPLLGNLGLREGLERFVREWSSHYGVAVEYQAIGFDNGQNFPATIEVAFARIAQEALNNVAKHAHASRVDLLLEARDGELRMVLEDDGVGFDASASGSGRGLGLVGMAERAALIGASLQIESSAEKGTSVFLRWAPNHQ